MAVYVFRCDTHGEVEHDFPLGTAPPAVLCPVCEARSRRIFTPPLVGSPLPVGLSSAIESAARTAEAPDVVTSLPPPTGSRRSRRDTITPAALKLPWK